MQIAEYKCPECGCERVYSIPKGLGHGVYCAECNTWICWTIYKKMKEIYKQIDNDSLNDDVSIRKTKTRNGITKMNCEKCGCLLYDSTSPKVEGQFDLVNAIYCPKCGRKLI